MKDNDGQYRQTLKRDELNVEKVVVPNKQLASGLATRKGLKTSQEEKVLVAKERKQLPTGFRLFFGSSDSVR